MPSVTLSSLITAPADAISDALAVAGDMSRCCLRDWLRTVPDPRKRAGRWHRLEFVLALAVCAFTAAGHDSPAAIAEWARGCSQETLALLDGRPDPLTRRIRPPAERTFRRILEKTAADAFNRALYSFLDAVRPEEPENLPDVIRHEREQRRTAAKAKEPGVPGLLEQAACDGKAVRGAVRPDGSRVHLMTAFHVSQKRTLAQHEVGCKSNEIPELIPVLREFNISGMVITADALCRHRHKASYADQFVMPTDVVTRRRSAGSGWRDRHNHPVRA